MKLFTVYEKQLGALRIMVEFAAVRFLDRLNRAATKVYASSRAIFSVAHFLASCLFQTDSSPRGGPLRRDEKPRPLHVLLHVHRHRDELKVPVVAIQAEIARVPSLDPPRRVRCAENPNAPARDCSLNDASGSTRFCSSGAGQRCAQRLQKQRPVRRIHFGTVERCLSRLREAAQSSNGNPAYCSATIASACFDWWI